MSAPGDLQTVSGRSRQWLVGETGPGERAKEPVSGAVAGEDPSGSIASVSRGGQADDENARLGVPETGQRAAPIGVPRT